MRGQLAALSLIISGAFLVVFSVGTKVGDPQGVPTVTRVAVDLPVTKRESQVTAGPTEVVELSTPIPQATCASDSGKPDPRCTPGAIDPRVTDQNVDQTICQRGYTETVRPPVSVTNKIKYTQMIAYGYDVHQAQAYELDHFVPLELGGAPQDVSNLWPQPWQGDWNAHQKDLVENHLHSLVCAHSMSLSAAQDKIRKDWTDEYKMLPKAISK